MSMRNEIPYTVENAYLTPPEPDEVANRALWRVQEAKEQRQKIQEEYEEFNYLIRDCRYLDFDIRDNLRESYERKISNLTYEIESITEHLREMGYAV